MKIYVVCDGDGAPVAAYESHSDAETACEPGFSICHTEMIPRGLQPGDKVRDPDGDLCTVVNTLHWDGHPHAVIEYDGLLCVHPVADLKFVE